MRVTPQPSRASDIAQPRPRPLLAPHTSAALPRIPKSTMPSPDQLSCSTKRNQQHAGQHQRGARQLYRGHDLVQSHPAEKDGGHWTESSEKRHLIRADAAQGLGGDENRQDRRKNRHGQGEAVYLGWQRKRRERPQQEELRDAESARDGHRVGGE